MKDLLKNIATIQLGFSFRAKLEPIPNGGVAVIQMKDLSEDNRLNNEDIVNVEMNDLKSKYRIKHNDIAFRSRGLASTAALIDKPLGNAIIAAPLFHLRVKESINLDPAYLCWFINQPATQSILTSKATGGTQKSIRKITLENLNVDIPPMDTQKRIVKLERLAIKEQETLRILADKRRQLTEGILMRLALETQ